MNTLPGQVPFAASFEQDHAAPEFRKILPYKICAGVSLQCHGSYVQHTVTFPLQQLIQLFFQENLTNAQMSLNSIAFICDP